MASRASTIVSAVPQNSSEDAAKPEDVLRLAEEYKKAAEFLQKQQPRGAPPLTWAPYRLSAIHAIELFLSALLLHKGTQEANIRAMQHNLAERAELAALSGLRLKKLTAEHLSKIDENREYLVSRYRPGMTSTLPPITRLKATLNEVARKVTAIMRRD